METLIILILAVVAAVAVGGFVVFWVDHRGGKDEDGPSPAPRRGLSPSSKKSSAPLSLVINFQITPSLNRHCLLAFNRPDTKAKSGTCSCMRNDVSLWSVFLRAPVFMAVDDNGCAVFFDAEGDGPAVRVTLLDVAGIERFNEVFLTGFLEYGEAVGGGFVWGVTEGPGSAVGAYGGELLVWDLEQGAVATRGLDPRAGGGVSGPVVSLVVEPRAIVVTFEQGAPVRLTLNRRDGFRRPDTVAQVVGGGPKPETNSET
ncbi:MAG: hypothetical protein RRC34_03085 [Lentisphaeria bacterium]|nr:hypothetical protein [Lentisphaeria bacterium]